MTTFEFVFAFYSIVASLTVTHMLAGYVNLRRAKSVRVYAPQLMWASAAFTIPIANWASLWELRLMTNWPNWSFLLLIASGLCQYLFCAFLTPDTRLGEDMDLRSYYEKNRIIFFAVFTASCAVDTAANFAFGGTDHFDIWLRNQLFTVLAYLLAVVSFLARPDWIRNAASAIMLALMTYFVIVATNLLTG
jgi:hypothetical protein